MCIFVGFMGTNVYREPGSAERQAEALREEGVEVETDGGVLCGFDSVWLVSFGVAE